MRIHVVPQTQGALTARAADLADGARALGRLAGEVLGVPVIEVAVDPSPSSTVDGVANRTALVRNREAQLAALEAPEGPVLTVGGDCGVELVPIGVSRFRHGDRLGVAWFDAHPDLNTGASSPSGAFHGMVLRSLFGEGDVEFAAAPALVPGRVALVGTRVFDAAERAAADRGLVVDAAGDAVGALRASGAEKVYLHLDLDVLDPGEFGGLNYPEPGGLTIAELVAAIRELAALEVVGAGLTECVSADENELRALVPVLEAVGYALTAGGRPGTASS